MGCFKHRETLIKRWEEDGKLYGILKCRWCSRFRRVHMIISGTSKPIMKTEQVIEEDEDQPVREMKKLG